MYPRRPILAKIPDELTDEQVVLLADIASTGFSGAESANIRIGDTVAVFAQGPIGLCATAGAKLMGASFIIGVEGDPVRMEMSKRMGAHVVLDPTQCDVIAEIKKLTGEVLTLLQRLNIAVLDKICGIGILCRRQRLRDLAKNRLAAAVNACHAVSASE